MEFFDVISKRRSVRRFTPKTVPEDVIRNALQAAIRAPNSSNTQTWNFYWVQSNEKKQSLVKSCFDQSAARTANQLIVVTADPSLWRRSQPGLIQWVEQLNMPKPVHDYYKKLIPLMYRWGFLNSLAPFKWLLSLAVGLFRPMARGPHTRRDLQEVAIKSAALACENLVLAISAQGYATCMMEGFDEWRVSRLLKLRCSERVVMVIGIGEEAEKGVWGPPYRLPLEKVLKII